MLNNMHLVFPILTKSNTWIMLDQRNTSIRCIICMHTLIPLSTKECKKSVWKYQIYSTFYLFSGVQYALLNLGILEYKFGHSTSALFVKNDFFFKKFVALTSFFIGLQWCFDCCEAEWRWILFARNSIVKCKRLYNKYLKFKFTLR